MNISEKEYIYLKEVEKMNKELAENLYNNFIYKQIKLMIEHERDIEK